ncbi:MAG: NADH-quinone oxidoreductase subunit H [Alistipes sp.]|jgi:formate hydrogenlyase subunit 4|nr:NADH-quinone oxidoreductase subunit H [Alistipes sp.]MBO7242935.1 NADH-quinone oxidoreductase subunit H [Alistipes sp.]
MLVKLLNTLLMVVVALSITGVINRTRALLAGRKGIRFFQHIYNVRLQLRKGAVYSTTTTALFRIAPTVYLGATLLAFLFIPIADLEPLLSFHGDIILVAYLLALSRVTIILAAMDTGSSFEGMGAAREALYGALVEPALMMGMATLALFCGYSSFADIFSMAQELDMNLTIVLFLLAYVFVIIMIIEAGRVPVDDPKTHLELTMIHEVMCLDYSGVDMGLIHIAGWLKNAIFAVIAANAIAVAVSFHWWFAAPLAILITGVTIGVIESLRARNKLSRNITYILTIVAMSALVLLTGFLLIQNIEI